MKKIILHIPHSSVEIPIKDGYVSDSRAIHNEIIKLTDWYTDDLFYSESDDMVIAPFSRIFCDVERFSDDELEEMSQFGMGALYEKFDDGNLLRKVNSELRELILKNYYLKHHKTFSDLVDTHIRENKTCLILDCHSFPSLPFNCSLVKYTEGPDFNIGTDTFHTPKHIIDASKDFFNSRSLSLGIDTPYSGSIVPMDFYKKDKRVNSIMLEVNRRLYLNEPTNDKSPGYQKTKEIVQDYIKLLKTL